MVYIGLGNRTHVNVAKDSLWVGAGFSCVCIWKLSFIWLPANSIDLVHLMFCPPRCDDDDDDGAGVPFFPSARVAYHFSPVSDRDPGHHATIIIIIADINLLAVPLMDPQPSAIKPWTPLLPGCPAQPCRLLLWTELDSGCSHDALLNLFAGFYLFFPLFLDLITFFAIQSCWPCFGNAPALVWRHVGLKHFAAHCIYTLGWLWLRSASLLRTFSQSSLRSVIHLCVFVVPVTDWWRGRQAAGAKGPVGRRWWKNSVCPENCKGTMNFEGRVLDFIFGVGVLLNYFFLSVSFDWIVFFF